MSEVPKNADGNFTRDMLDSDDAYILDVGEKVSHPLIVRRALLPSTDHTAPTIPLLAS